MTYHPMLPFGVLIVAIYAVSWLRNVLAGYAIFGPQNSPFRPCERIVRGFQIAMIILLVIGSVSTSWDSLPRWCHRLANPGRKEPQHVIIPTEYPPTGISPDDPQWLQNEKRRDMQLWEARTRQRYKLPN